MRQIDAIIGLSFGTGKTNQYLAKVVEKIAKELPKIPRIIVQKEIAENLDEKLKKRSIVISEHRQKGKYLDTIEVLKQARMFCETEDRVIIVAQKYHWDRACKIAKILRLEPLKKEEMKWYNDLDVPFDWNSKQWWTKCLLFYLIWELIARIFLWFRRNFIARCEFWEMCPYFHEQNITCVSGDQNYCGYYREISKNNG